MTSSDFNVSSYVAASSATCAATRWLTEEVFKLIDIVQQDEAIYNPRHKYYFCRPYVENFWREVDVKLEKNPGASLAKWTNLRISFRREYTNYLEEKVPPCWSYFDRMFFLHPYLRKKHPQPKSLDTQVQDALVHLKNLSSRMQRERGVSSCVSADTSLNNTNHHYPSNSPPQTLDNYLEYIDENDNNNSEMEEIMEEQRSRFPNTLDNDIKSECEENPDDFDAAEVAANIQYVQQHSEEERLEVAHEATMRKITFDTSMAASSSASPTSSEKCFATQQRLQNLNRLQLHGNYEDMRCKRPRSHELVQPSGCTSTNASSSSQVQTNISFVRPTFTKPIDIVSTTTSGNNFNPGARPNDCEISLGSSTTSTIAVYNTQRHLSHQQRQRMDAVADAMSNNSGGSGGNANVTAVGHLDLCDCKTDPDAMFLMSLLPDIQKLNGRDRGKIKIAFQNTLQDYLYPD